MEVKHFEERYNSCSFFYVEEKAEEWFNGLLEILKMLPKWEEEF